MQTIIRKSDITTINDIPYVPFEKVMHLRIMTELFMVEHIHGMTREQIIDLTESFYNMDAEQ
jgi:hypothetical protein